MPLRVPLSGQPTLAQLCHDLKVVAHDKHHDNELRSNGRSLYIKLRSACCTWRRESARHDHRRRAVALVRERFEAALDDLGAGFMKERLVIEFLPAAGAGRAAPVRVRDVIALDQLVAHARRLAVRLSGPLAVMLAAATARQTQAAWRLPAQPRFPTDLPALSPPLARGELVCQNATSSKVQRSPARVALGLSFGQRATDLLDAAERLAARPERPAGSPDHRRLMPEEFLALAASFPSEQLITPAEQRRIDHFMGHAGPILDKVTSDWRAIEPQQQLDIVQGLVRTHQVSYGYGAVEVHFDGRLHGAARLSPDGARVILPVAHEDVTRNFDEFIHLLVYGLTLRHQRHLATHLDTVHEADLELARLMRAHQLVPMDTQQLVQAFSLRLPAAREAWLSSASHRHATALADLVAGRVYAALPRHTSRLPRLAHLGASRTDPGQW